MRHKGDVAHHLLERCKLLPEFFDLPRCFALHVHRLCGQLSLELRLLDLLFCFLAAAFIRARSTRIQNLGENTLSGEEKNPEKEAGLAQANDDHVKHGA